MSDRRTGKTTRLCQQVAAALEADPELTVVVTGAHVLRNVRQYIGLLREVDADLSRVTFVAPSALERRVRVGREVKLFVDDFDDLTGKDREIVMNVERYLL